MAGYLCHRSDPAPLQPSRAHLPIERYWTPDEFSLLVTELEALGFAHVEAGPLVRSSYHAAAGKEAAVFIQRMV